MNDQEKEKQLFEIARSRMSDQELMSGKPVYFDLHRALEVAEDFVRSDETLMALHLLKNLPGFYREFPPPEVTELIRKIQSKMFLHVNYMQDPTGAFDVSTHNECKWNNIESLAQKIDIPFCAPRGPLTVELVKKYNDDGKTPFLIELGPFDYWLPLGLSHKNLDFRYYGIDLSRPNQLDAAKRLKSHWRTYSDLQPGQPVVFICFEVVEHMLDLKEFELYASRIPKPTDVLLSTPRNTFFGGRHDWQSEDIQHLRTFTPQEFFNLADQTFPKMKWMHYPTPSQVLVGKAITP